MSYAVSGVDGKVLSGSTDMDVQGYSVDVEVVEIDTTTTADGGWEDAIDGTIKVSGSFEFFWNPTKNPFNSLINLMPGAGALTGIYPTLKLNLDGTNYLQGTAKINKLSLKSATKEGKMFTATFRSKGAWTRPSV
jgi:hypothetical protein